MRPFRQDNRHRNGNWRYALVIPAAEQRVALDVDEREHLPVVGNMRCCRTCNDVLVSSDLEDTFMGPDPGNEVVWAAGRRPERTYAHTSFWLNRPQSKDHGQRARWICKVFDVPAVSVRRSDYEEYVVQESPGGRVQIKLLVVREAGQVKELRLEKVPTNAGARKMETLLTLRQDGASRLIHLLRGLEDIPIEGSTTYSVDQETIRSVTEDPAALQSVYSSAPMTIRQLMENDTSARDLVALAHRRAQLERFRNLLDDPVAFEQEKETTGGSEAVWQRFLEENPWILGVGLSGQLLTSWNDSRLEQVVVGSDVVGPGKRTDALLRTNGRIRSMVFAEIKHHETKLLGGEYRPGCWAPSKELTGGTSQIQQTVYRAQQRIGERLADKDETGADTTESTYLHRPRSFLIIGRLDELRGPGGGVHQDKQRSFELHRRNLYEPEIITFDELLARAEWHVSVAERSADHTAQA